MQRDLTGVGWRFPVSPDARGTLQFLGGEEKIRQSIQLILSTAPGERQMLPEFGCGIHDLVFQPQAPALRGAVERSIREALVRFEPRIDVLDVRAETAPEGRNHLIVRIDYRVRANNAFYNLVYPFFLAEGSDS